MFSTTAYMSDWITIPAAGIGTNGDIAAGASAYVTAVVPGVRATSDGVSLCIRADSTTPQGILMAPAVVGDEQEDSDEVGILFTNITGGTLTVGPVYIRFMIHRIGE